MNFDGSKHDGEAIVGGIIQNSQGVQNRGYSRECGSVSSNEVEVFGLLWGVMLANSMGVQNLIMEGDSMLVIKDASGDNKMSWKAISIIRDAQYILNRINDVRIQHVYSGETRWLTAWQDMITKLLMLKSRKMRKIFRW